MDHQLFLVSAALCFLTILKFSIAADTLSANTTLADGDVLACPSQMFELGFFSPRISKNRFLGIWYKATPDVVVWVANRGHPINSLNGVLTLAQNGSLILSSDESSMIWSSNSSIAASSPLLQLLDTGNLVVVEKSMNIWQSFDYPGDTRLPGMKMVDDPDAGLDKHLTSWKSPDDPSVGDYVYRIENHGLPQISVSKGNKKTCRTGPWNGLFFAGTIRNRPVLETEVAFNNIGRLVSLSEPYNSSRYLRMTMSYSGSLQRYIMNEQRDGWILMFSMPSESCDNYGWCGPNTLCKPYKIPMCECLKGFMPKKGKEWSAYLWTSGCSRVLPLDSCKEDGFMKVEEIKSPDTLSYRVEDNMTADECHDECLKNCNCTAFAAPYLINKTNSCLMWFGDLIDAKEFAVPKSGEGTNISIRVPKSELELATGRKKRKTPAKFVHVAAASSCGMVVLLLTFGGIVFRMRSKRQACKKEREDLELPLFGLATIAAATNNFSDENLLGEGGFGPVYKGNLSAEIVVAVKRMSRDSGQGAEEFKNEAILIAKLQHRNLVRILGCCIEGEEKMLIYEYMQNKSLDYFIYEENRRAVLSWEKRFDIIMGIARGLVYLHHDSRLKIIHRDLKTSNILLDEKLNPKISDFGLARIFEGDQIIERTKRVVGTFGYMAPEYALKGRFSVKSDVFSMGVVILEIVSGKRNRDFSHSSLLEQAWLHWKENREFELMDPCYNSSYVEWQVKRCIQVGLLCVQNSADERPLMPSVVLMLSTEDIALPEPNKPGFVLDTSSRNTPGNEERISGSLTITQVEPR